MKVGEAVPLGQKLLDGVLLPVREPLGLPEVVMEVLRVTERLGERLAVWLALGLREGLLELVADWEMLSERVTLLQEEALKLREEVCEGLYVPDTVQDSESVVDSDREGDFDCVSDTEPLPL